MQKQKLYSIKKLKNNNFSLILSGGASLGLAHIGTIKFLEENNLRPTEIIGTSIGSIIGALYALGKTSENIGDILKDIKIKDLFEIKYFQGRIDYRKAKTLLRKILKDTKMKDTRIELKIIATNLRNGQEKIFTKKDPVSIYNATLASSAIPGILSAKKIRNEVYIDGSVSSNLPVEVAKEENIKLTINVINQKIKNYKYHNPKKGLISNLATKFKIIKRTSLYYITNQTRLKIKHIKKMILIEPDLRKFNSYSITNHEKIIKAGYLETKKYFNRAEKQRKRRKKKTALEKIIDLPLIKTKKLIDKISSISIIK